MNRFLSLVCALLTLATIPASAEDAKNTKQQIKGGIPKEEIDATIEKRIRQFRACYEKELFAFPELSGTVNTKFVIGAEGKVTNAVVEATTLNNAGVEACILGVFKRLSFPKPIGGGTVETSYLFSFQPTAKSTEAPKAAP